MTLILSSLLCTISQCAYAQGTLNALNIAPGPGIPGYILGGVGWSFVPTSDLLVTGISSTDPQVDFWLGTNQNVASFFYAGPYETGGFVFNNGAPTNFQSVSNLLLFAGQTYFISTQETNFTQLASPFFYSFNGTNGPAFSTSTYISQFASYLLSTNGQWSPLVTPPDNSYNVYIGPNFQFEVIPEPAIDQLLFPAAIVFFLRRVRCRAG